MWTTWEHEEHFLRPLKGLIWTSPTLATMVKEPSAMAIFLLLGHGEYEEKTFDVLVMWLVALESIIRELLKVVPETFSPMENGNLLEYAKEQELEGFSRLLISELTISISS